MSAKLVPFSPAAAVPAAAQLRRAMRRLSEAGFEVQPDAGALARHRGLAGTDEERLAALHRVAAAAPSVAMASTGGYGLTPLLDAIDWKRLARAASRGTRWVGHGEFTLLQMGLLAHTGTGSWAGPMACDDFGAAAADGGVDEVTRDCFVEAMDGSLEAVGFRTGEGFDGLAARGVLWGGSLLPLLSLLGTRHWPAAAIKAGVLFVDTGGASAQHIERGLLQLRQAGVLQAQRAVLLGGRGLPQALGRVRAGLKTPLLTGLPAGPGHPRLTLPFGRRVQLLVQGREVLILW